jgi:predicted metal-dependent peptidase
MSTFRDQVKCGKGHDIDPAVVAQATERLGKSRARLLLQQPFYGVLLSQMAFIPESAIDTMATDGVRIYFNSEFTMRLTPEEVFGVLLHEVDHCIYQHCTQKRRLNRDHHRWNCASDYAINLEIRDMQYVLPADILLDEKYRGCNAEQIYDMLPEDCGNLKTLDMHINNTDENSWDDMEDQILSAYEMAKNSMGAGKFPAGLQRWIDKLRRSRVKWERIFHKYVGMALAKDDYSYTRVNKRFIGQGVYLPDLRSYAIGSVVLAIDTSGSISRPCLAQFASELARISHLVSEITVMTCDCVIQEVVKVSQFSDFLKKLEFKGGGGTSHEPVLNEIKKRNLQPELLICLTDMYSDIDSLKKPPYPVLWVSTSEKNTAPFGHVVQIPNDKGEW